MFFLCLYIIAPKGDRITFNFFFFFFLERVSCLFDFCDEEMFKIGSVLLLDLGVNISK